MEITQLHYFKTVAQYGSFTKAAEALHITQSALSRSIASLEQDIGFHLFERKGNRIHLNQNGTFFLTRVTGVLTTLEKTVEETRAMAGLERGVVRIAISETIFIKHIIHDFLHQHPDVRISCQLQSDEQIKTSLEEGAINFAVTRSPILGPELTWTPLFTDQMLAMLPYGHPLQKRDSLYLEELSEEHFIISNVGYHVESVVVDMCSKAGFAPYIVYEGCGEDLTGILVGEGLGVMLAPYSISMGVTALNIYSSTNPNTGIPIRDDFARIPIGIASKFGQFQSDAALNLYHAITSYYQELPPCPIVPSTRKGAQADA